MMRARRRRAGARFVVTSVFLAACALPLRPLPGRERSIQAAPDAWAADVDFLARELPKRHKNLFFKMKASEFRALVQRFKESLPRLNEDEFQVGLARLVASVGDAHTSFRPPLVHAFPLMLYWFKEGIVVTNTLREHEGLLYQKLAAVGGRPVDGVVKAFADILSHDNEAHLRNVIPQVLASAEILHGLGIIADTERAVFSFETETGRRTEVAMRSLSLSAPPAWAVDMSDMSAWPLFMRDRQKAYWHVYLPEFRTVYFKYNSCREMRDRPFRAFVEEMFAEIEAKPVVRLIVDLRNNGGGDEAIFNPFFGALANSAKVNRQGSLFVVLGRQTFSSAVLNAVEMRKRTPAIFVGEPTGGKPNHFGSFETLTLPRTKLTVTYSTAYFQRMYDDPPSLMPDVDVEMSAADRRARRDPVLEAILSREF